MTVIDKRHTHIRRYTASDIPVIVKAVCDELPKLPHYEGITPKPDRVEFLLRNALNDESAFHVTVLCESHTNKVVGGCAAYCVTCLFSDDKVTNDLFLFIWPEWRNLLNAMKLIDSYKDWAKRRGAKIIGTTHTAGYRSDAMDMLILRSGFECIGKLYHLKQKQ